MFGKKVSSKVSADDINEAKKLIRQFGGFLRLAEIIERLGNVEASAAESESSLAGLVKKKESATKDLASINGKVKMAEGELVTATKIKDSAISDTKKIDNSNRAMERDRETKKSAHDSVMLGYARDENAANGQVTLAQEKATRIIQQATAVKDEAAAQKAEANQVDKLLVGKRAELAEVIESIAAARAQAKSQIELALKKF